MIKPDTRYSFSVPATAKEQRIVNVLTGNFCLVSAVVMVMVMVM